MILKGAFFATICTALVMSSGASAADAYHPDEFLGLDLSKAVLSPKPLGPATEFAPVAVEAKSDRNSEPSWARNELKTEPKKVAVQHVRAARVRVQQVRAARVHVAAPIHVAAPVRDGRAHGVARTRLARRHSNPLDAQAFDTRIQVWPCRSGGICNWKRSAE